MSETVMEQPVETYSKKDRLFSTLTARLLFFLLLIADVLWGIYSFLFFIFLAIASLITFMKVNAFKEVAASYWLATIRSSVCAVSLFLALFSPGFGVMVACTYFLMYDKKGLEEFVPTSLQTQFNEFFAAGESEEP